MYNVKTRNLFTQASSAMIVVAWLQQEHEIVVYMGRRS